MPSRHAKTRCASRVRPSATDSRSEPVVGVALASIGPDLQMSAKATHWVVNAYFLTFTCLVAVGGRLADSLGRRGFFVLGIAVFGLSSAAAGFAQNGAWLVAARAVQGTGAAILFPTSWAILTSAFLPEQRGFAFGIQTTVGGMFMALGPLVGGKGARFADEELNEVAGLSKGALPPLGLLFGLRTIYDRSLLEVETVNFNAGTRTS